MIGGPGVIVEVDESKFGKVKYGQEHQVDGAWILGGVERTKKRRFFLIRVDNRKEETLIKVLSRHVTPSSIVITDLWREYLNIDDKLNIQHLIINHGRNF
jgi:transposase-like protein